MKILSSLLAATAAILTLASCESTPTEKRFVAVDDSSFEPQRTVLIEEYTGQTCVNCPGAHKLLGELEGRFNTANHTGIISVGIHIPNFGRPAPAGLVAPEGQEYSVGVDAAPSARINRRTGVVSTDRWTGAVINEIIRKSPVTFTELNANLKSDGKNISISGKIYAADNIKNARLQLWLVEDDIVAPQLLPDGADANYVHHSVFRGAINGINGKQIDLKEKKETAFEVKSYPMADYVNTANLRVVAFVFTDSEGVLNAHHAKIQ